MGSNRPASRLMRSLHHGVARTFPSQSFLYNELVARFPGTARRYWYLSDGGHFENMGAYELIRRRLPLVVIVDAEEDVDFAFEGLANLVRKARLDFGAEITFFDESAFKSPGPESELAFGSLDQLRRQVPTANDVLRLSKARCAIGKIKYSGQLEDKGGLTNYLVYLKPTLTGREPADILQYARSHAAFPHEPTTDQFFDEAQWESYRKLGQMTAATLFDLSATLPGSVRQAFERHGLGR
jgi:hypothetical protein